MKRIVQVAVVAFACSASLAWSQQRESEVLSVAQAGPAEGAPVMRDSAVKSRKPTMYEISGLAGDGSFPSRGGPVDD